MGSRNNGEMKERRKEEEWGNGNGEMRTRISPSVLININITPRNKDKKLMINN
jgi:hypothetical protein